MSDEVTLSAAGPADAGLLDVLTQAAWHGTVAADSSAFRESAATLEALFAAGGGALVLRVVGEPAGSVRWLPAPHPLPSWEVKRLGVLPSLRGRGLGDRLMTALLEAAAATGIRRVQLGVRADQPRLIDWYRRHGFAVDPQVALSSRNPLTGPPVTMSRRLEPADAPAGPRADPAPHALTATSR